MASAEEQQSSKATYVMDAENAAEMARLIQQDRLITKAMGGLFPEHFDLSTISDVLDIACGPGGWVFDVATAYPSMKVQGIDISNLMVEFACTVAEEKELSNVDFQVMNVMEPLDFPANSFDFVNARLIGPFMTVPGWTKLIQECFRVLRPGGFIRFTECEMPFTTSLAFEQLNGLVNAASHLSQQTFSPDGRHLTIIVVLRRLLQEAGFSNFVEKPSLIDFSAGTEAHLPMYQNWSIVFKLIQPFLIKMGVITQEDVDVLYAQMQTEGQSDSFCGMWFFLSVLGQKP